MLVGSSGFSSFMISSRRKKVPRLRLETDLILRIHPRLPLTSESKKASISEYLLSSVTRIKLRRFFQIPVFASFKFTFPLLRLRFPMGNNMTCIPGKGSGGGAVPGSMRISRQGSKATEEEQQQQQLHRRLLAVAIQQHQLSQRFDGSTSSRRIGGSTSSRRRNISDSFSSEKHVQVPICIENIETKKIILVHGEGFGAWCWYKIISLLEEAGLDPVALDLTSSGMDCSSANIASLAEYSKPLTDHLDCLPEDEKVILVGHSFGGASLSYAMECYPQKISKAVFLCATMVSNGQKPLEIFAKEVASAETFMQKSQSLFYSNGKDKPPTGFMFNKEQMKGLYFNQTPSKDMILASLSMRPVPLAPITESLILTPGNYGSVYRYFIQTLDDRLLPPDAQEKMVRDNPPQGVYKIKGGDHCPFFSKPRSLNKILLEIAQLSPEPPNSTA